MNTEIFLFGILIVSTLTGLTTEAVKNFLSERKINYYANTLAGAVSLVMSVAVSTAYIVLMDIAVTTHVIVYVIALVFMSWLCAMVGYDKVIQTLTQIKTYKKE